MKKLIALIAVIATMASLLAVPVSAQNYFVDDFDNPPASGKLEDMEGWNPYDSNFSVYGGTTSFEDGAVKIGYNGNARHYWRRTYSVPTQDHVLMFDIKSDVASSNLGTRMWIGGTRVMNDSFRGLASANEWYTVMIVVTGGATKADFYYRKTADANGAWTKLYIEKDGVCAENTSTKFVVGFDSHSTPDRTGNIWYDNWKAYDELWFDNMNISLEDATVEEIADVVSGGTLSIDFDLYDGNVSFNDDMTLATNATAKTVLVALDKDMKMVGCSTVNIPLKGGFNTVSATLELSDDESAPNYYGNLTEGGQINLYMWNNMQPICDPIVID